MCRSERQPLLQEPISHCAERFYLRTVAAELKARFSALCFPRRIWADNSPRIYCSAEQMNFWKVKAGSRRLVLTDWARKTPLRGNRPIGAPNGKCPPAGEVRRRFVPALGRNTRLAPWIWGEHGMRSTAPDVRGRW